MMLRVIMDHLSSRAEVMDLLELTPIKNRMIGEPASADGLAPGQRKILTIGVELVSNCPIIFLG